MASSKKRNGKRSRVRPAAPRSHADLAIERFLKDRKLSVEIAAPIYERAGLKKLGEDPWSERREIVLRWLAATMEGLKRLCDLPGGEPIGRMRIMPRSFMCGWSVPEDVEFVPWDYALQMPGPGITGRVLEHLRARWEDAFEFAQETERDYACTAWMCSLSSIESCPLVVAVVHSHMVPDAVYLYDGKSAIVYEADPAADSLLSSAVAECLVVSHEAIDDDVQDAFHTIIASGVAAGMSATVDADGGIVISDKGASVEMLDAAHVAVCESIDVLTRRLSINERLMAKACLFIAEEGKQMLERERAQHEAAIAKLRRTSGDEIARLRNLYEKSRGREAEATARAAAAHAEASKSAGQSEPDRDDNLIARLDKLFG